MLLGKNAQPLLDLPATKEGINIYVTPASGQELDSRGSDMRLLTKYLKTKGVGGQSGESDVITKVKFDKGRVKIHVGGVGEGRSSGIPFGTYPVIVTVTLISGLTTVSHSVSLLLT